MTGGWWKEGPGLSFAVQSSGPLAQVLLSSDLSMMCDMDKKCSVQHKFICFGQVLGDVDRMLR